MGKFWGVIPTIIIQLLFFESESISIAPMFIIHILLKAEHYSNSVVKVEMCYLVISLTKMFWVDVFTLLITNIMKPHLKCLTGLK